MISVKEIKQFAITPSRYRWLKDDDIDRYIGFTDKVVLGDIYDLDEKSERHFEILENNELVGDVRLIYNNDDFINKRAEFIIIIGKRNAGIGSQSFPLILEACKKYYNSLYCYIHKSNIRSLKLFKKNGFMVDDIKDNEFLLSYQF